MEDNIKKYLAEFVGTFLLVLIGVGAAVAGAGYVGTALAFGTSIVILAYSVGRISGGHVNPAVSLAMAIRGDISWKQFIGYVVSQFLGAICGSAVVGTISGGYKSTGANLVEAGKLLSIYNGDHAWVAYLCAFLLEMFLTFAFVLAVLGVTEDNKFSAQGGLVIGVALAGVHLVGDGVTNTSVNPARSFSAALFSLIGGNNAAMKEIWVFLLAPLLGGAMAAFLWKSFASRKKETVK